MRPCGGGKLCENVSRPRTIKRSQVKRRNGEGLEPRLGTRLVFTLFTHGIYGGGEALGCWTKNERF